MKVVSRVDQCGGCDLIVEANSVLCIACSKCVCNRCSGVKGSLRKVRGVSNVSCVYKEG